MKYKIKRLPIALLTFLVIGILLLSGCDGENNLNGLQPSSLVGTWHENGYNRQITLEEDGDFQYITTSAIVRTQVEGRGTWEATGVDLTFNLNSGHFR